jgi:uncharacterized protein
MQVLGHFSMQGLTYSALRLVALTCILYVAALVLTYTFQRNLQYHPSSTVYKPQALGLVDTQDLTLTTPDGEKIMAWYKPAPAGHPTIIYFHGNAGGLSSRAEKIAYFVNQGFGFLGVSYRGYEGSTGNPSEAGFITDAKTAYDWLRTKGVMPKNILLIGESIGTGVAVQLGAAQEVGAIALESPYASAVDVGASSYWFFPVHWLMKDQFRSVDYIKNVKAPLLITHGKLDALIPFSQGQKLFDLASEPKQLNALEDAGHELSFNEKTWAAEAAFFEKVIGGNLAKN